MSMEAKRAPDHLKVELQTVVSWFPYGCWEPNPGPLLREELPFQFQKIKIKNKPQKVFTRICSLYKAMSFTMTFSVRRTFFHIVSQKKDHLQWLSSSKSWRISQYIFRPYLRNKLSHPSRNKTLIHSSNQPNSNKSAQTHGS